MQTSQIEKLEHDDNNPDRANFHPLYVLVYSIFYLLLQVSLVIGVMFRQFSYRIEMTLGLCSAYFILIFIWKPYHSSANAHNHFLKLNHGCVVFFLIICEIFSKIEKLSNEFYIISMYGIMVMLISVIFGGFVRIFIERSFRKSLEQNSSLLDVCEDLG